MNLKLTKPIIFFDIEATGVDPAKDRIVELSYLKVYPNGMEETKTVRINPEMPMPQEAFAIHGISDDDLKDCPTFKNVAKQIAADIQGCDVAGYNSNKFDIPILVEEFLRVDIDIHMREQNCVDVQNIFHKKEQRTLSAAYRFYCDAELVGAHGAEADTRATYEVLKAQLDRYSDLENNVKYLAEYSAMRKFVDYAGRLIFNENDEVIVNFGKHKGKKLKDVFKSDLGYYDWVQKGDFTLDTKRCFMLVKLGKLGK